MCTLFPNQYKLKTRFQYLLVSNINPLKENPISLLKIIKKDVCLMKTTKKKREGAHVFYMTQSYQSDTKCHYCLRHTTLLSRMKVAGLKKDIHLTGKAGSIEISIVSILIVVFDLLIYSTLGIIKCSNLAFRFISLLTSLMIVFMETN